ncbi:DUF6777 domain-containing protein [Actinopolymorpha sp. B17G11]|uniref:DUF6777 domain-containing protein n=1 Tax=Actinopolymorpha sp. B17G11 TaxID=3160861 RepID=UPI0032E449D0
MSTPSNAGQTYQGSTPGLYAGNPQPTKSHATDSIDRAPAGRPDNARHPAGIIGVGAPDVPGYVGGPSNFLLRSYTYATTYGYRGNVTSSSSLLHAGTAVFIDKQGTIVVKCNCGNPAKVILQSKVAQATFVGSPGPAFSPSTVTAVQPATNNVQQLMLVQINTGVIFDRELGANDVPDTIIDTVPTNLAM